MSGNIARAVRQACREWPHRPAVVEVSTSRVTTFEQLSALVDRQARALRAALGDPQPNRPVVAVTGTAETVETLASILACDQVGVVALVRPAPGRATWFRQLAAAAPAVALASDGTVSPLPGGPRRGGVDPDTYQVVATSGSTGVPKLVQLTDTGTLLATAVYRSHARISPGEAVAVPQSLATVGALPSGVLPAILDGGTAVLTAGGGIGSFLEGLVEQPVVFAMAVTGWWQACLRARGLPQVPGLRLLGVGGSAWQHLVPGIQRWLPGAVILGNYGLSETHGPALQVTSAQTRRFTSVTGRAVGGLQVAVRDADGSEVPAGSSGVLWLRGDLVTPGFLGGPVDAGPDTGGWLCTGDVAVLLEDSWVRVVDRADDLVNVAGRKVYPAEVEAALLGLAGVTDCAVVRSSGPAETRRLGAFVVREAGVGPATVAEAGVRRQVIAAVGDHAVPSLVELVDDLPRTGNGKVDRRALQARLDAALAAT
mgnify:CR=1 FL=1